VETQPTMASTAAAVAFPTDPSRSADGNGAPLASLFVGGRTSSPDTPTPFETCTPAPLPPRRGRTTVCGIGGVRLAPTARPVECPTAWSCRATGQGRSLCLGPSRGHAKRSTNPSPAMD
jgi:hypothetical protein